ncbi:MAG: CBS domain-containing protein [Succinivibrionaceae bacterium]|jgi:magnesium and cobalt transporter|nr:CBS domain-containing protein [Succinivibrionaceae bacterium]
MLDYPSSNKEENLIDKITSLFQSEPENVEELTEIIQNASNNNVINKDTLNMIEGIFELSKLRVRDIMVPRSSMVSVLINDPIETILNKVVTAGHSRYPVLSEDQEHIDGLLLAKDLLTIENNTNEFKIEKILRPIMVVPESKRLDFLLKDFQKKRYHLAVVIDEFGSYSGVVTIEDVLEIIVGTIGDEYDENPENNADIREAGKDLYLVNGMTSIVDFNEYFNVNIDNNEVETVAGIVISQLGHIPRVGEQTKVQKFEFKVLSVDKRRINTLQVKVDSDEETEPQEEESGNYE